MLIPKTLRLASVVCATLCLAAAVAALAQEQQAADKKGPEKNSADKAPAGGGSPEAGFAEFMKMNQPGEHHAHLKQFVGTFDSESEMFMTPGAPAQKGKGVQKSQVILDGRYLHGEYSGDMMGMKFQGVSIMGYDNQKKKYFNAWIDSMSTGLITFDGTCDKDGKVFTFTGVHDDTMTGRKTKVRHVTTVVTPGKHTFEWYDTQEDGKEQLSMRMTYTRKNG